MINFNPYIPKSCVKILSRHKFINFPSFSDAFVYLNEDGNQICGHNKQ